ncbi:adenosine 5'-monophosphoramidase [Perkinsela sp. CCAP 1560/4]|nr:adenosine 5'-monophosphoramidase [Perkinsela sp. CCAP 1560/4]|eukprot:KNH05402.1 adenosine 5'-monophosphoramidase [Perkinsela sp. CCAP 1560/4]
MEKGFHQAMRMYSTRSPSAKFKSNKFDKSCAFCRIIQGIQPAITISSNASCTAIMDVRPLSRGHCLVLPRKHFHNLHQVDKKTAIGMTMMILKICSAFKKCDYNILLNNGITANQTVPHVHYHIIPKTTSDGLHLGWNPTFTTPSSLQREAKRIGKSIRQ